MNIALFGIMASGKTSSGKLLAKKLGCRFYDADTLIVKKSGMPINAIFAKKGEPAFRRLETKVLKQLSNKKRCVIAAGGGAITRPVNVRNLKKNGLVISLLSSAEAILKRTAKDRSRPLLNTPDRKKTVLALIRKRRPLYAKYSDLLIDTSKMTPRQIASRVNSYLNERGFVV